MPVRCQELCERHNDKQIEGQHFCFSRAHYLGRGQVEPANKHTDLLIVQLVWDGGKCSEEDQTWPRVNGVS